MRFIHPVDKVSITQHFGENPQTYAQFGLKGHNGIDYRTRFVDSPLGRRYVLAPAAGTIEEVGNQGTKGYGFTKLYVKLGLLVKKGDRIALSGNTGFSSGPHIHWGWRPKNLDSKNGFAGYEDQEKMIGDEPECNKKCPKHCV